MTATYAVLTILFYVASLGLYVGSLYSSHALAGRAASACLAGGLVFHYLMLLERSHWVHSVPYQDLYGSMSLFGWLLALTYLGLELFHRQRSVGAFVVPVVLVLLLAGSLTHRATPLPPPAHGVVFVLHVTLSILAYAAFALSFVLSVMFLVEERVLRRHKLGSAVWRFPPLELLDRMSRSSVIVGLVTICAGTVLGYVSVDRQTGRVWHSDPKYLITILVLLLYAAYLLIGRSANWRGARASRFCVFNFAVVILSFTVVNLFLTKAHRYF
ncbi:MAG TPA: cytochrome c biogenesis protein CcsA [Methylomirabilota bacterium]|nr:cytochrome c biogenesis protein CcsA [Methylomirabilota bacterium]